jgi:UDPglucose 6-dehydrogenase
MKICIIGTGYVGLVTGACHAEIGHEVICVDNNSAKISLLKKNKIPIYEPGLEALVKKNQDLGALRFSESIEEGVRFAETIFIAVSTPSRADGSADLSAVENVARLVAQSMTEYKLIVDKSTVPVKTGEKVKDTIGRFCKKTISFDVASNPEFLREGSAIQDTLFPDRIVFGVSSKKAEELLREIYAPIQAPIIVTDVKSAEIIKHASNSFLAMKISFINAVSHICDLSGADIQEVALGMGLDKRIGKQFLNPGIGYGGSCFPKDVSAFIHIAKTLGYDFDLLRSVEKVNADQEEYFYKKIEETFWVLKGKRFAVWGLSFKPNTDDIRQSPILKIIRRLKEEGSTIVAYDPQAMPNTKIVLPDIHYAEDPYTMLSGCDGLIVATEWDVFVQADLDRVKAALTQPIVVDGRNIFDPSTMKKKGFTYVSVGRPKIHS